MTPRAVVIWVSGLISSAIFGGLLGEALARDNSGASALAGALAFTCVRLWRNPEPLKRDLPIRDLGRDAK